MDTNAITMNCGWTPLSEANKLPLSGTPFPLGAHSIFISPPRHIGGGRLPELGQTHRTSLPAAIQFF